MLTEVAMSAGTVNGMVGGRSPTSKRKASASSRKCSSTSSLENRCAYPCFDRGGALCAGAGAVRRRARLSRFGGNNRLGISSHRRHSGRRGVFCRPRKTRGKDIAQKKATYPAVIGLERSLCDCERFAMKAIAELALLGTRFAASRIAEFLVLRRALNLERTMKRQSNSQA